MARKRELRPKFFTNEYLAELPFEARLLFAGLWTIADRRGRLEDRPRRIKGQIFPYDNLDVDTLLQMLADSEEKFIVRYVIEGKTYIQISNFEKNQNVHKDEQESTIPPPYEQGANTVQEPYEQGANMPCSLKLVSCSLDLEACKTTTENSIEFSSVVCAETNENARSTPNAALAPLETDKKKAFSKKPTTPFPDGFVITPAIAEWTRQKIPDCDIGSEFEAFHDHHVSHGNRFVDWDAAWRTWIQRKLQFRARAPSQKSAPAAKEKAKSVDRVPEQIFQKPEDQPEEWVKALKSIREIVGDKCFLTWIDPVACHGIRDGTLELTVPTESFRTCLLENYTPILLKATGAREISVRQWRETG